MTYHYPVKLIFLILFLLSSTVLSAQKLSYTGFPSVVWPKLYNVSYTRTEEKGIEYEKPVFTKEVRALDGKVVTLPGFLVPFDGGMKAKRFMLSSLPLNACFFCGVGGPETVVEVFSVKDVTYTDKPVQVTGTLRLNDSDPDRLIYTLEKAEFLGEIDF